MTHTRRNDNKAPLPRRPQPLGPRTTGQEAFLEPPSATRARTTGRVLGDARHSRIPLESMNEPVPTSLVSWFRVWWAKPRRPLAWWYHGSLGSGTGWLVVSVLLLDTFGALACIDLIARGPSRTRAAGVLVAVAVAVSLIWVLRYLTRPVRDPYGSPLPSWPLVDLVNGIPAFILPIPLTVARIALTCLLVASIAGVAVAEIFAVGVQRLYPLPIAGFLTWAIWKARRIPANTAAVVIATPDQLVVDLPSVHVAASWHDITDITRGHMLDNPDHPILNLTVRPERLETRYSSQLEQRVNQFMGPLGTALGKAVGRSEFMLPLWWMREGPDAVERLVRWCSDPANQELIGTAEGRRRFHATFYPPAR